MWNPNGKPKLTYMVIVRSLERINEYGYRTVTGTDWYIDILIYIFIAIDNFIEYECFQKLSAVRRYAHHAMLSSVLYIRIYSLAVNIGSL